jgi:hypothetical protein
MCSSLICVNSNSQTWPMAIQNNVPLECGQPIDTGGCELQWFLFRHQCIHVTFIFRRWQHIPTPDNTLLWEYHSRNKEKSSGGKYTKLNKKVLLEQFLWMFHNYEVLCHSVMSVSQLCLLNKGCLSDIKLSKGFTEDYRWVCGILPPKIS